jgi:transglutaminase-like putative cysteine protease
MAIELLVRVYRRFQPRYGWLVFALLLATLACLVLSVLEVEWVPDDDVVIPAVLLGFVAAAILCQHPIRPTGLWLFLILGGTIAALVLAAELWPPLAVLRGGHGTLLEYWRLRGALFIDRTAGWYQAVSAGGRSTETVVFTLLLALAGWFVAALLAWSVYRARQPYMGLTAVGLALAANTFYGRAGLYWAAIFFGLAVTVATYLYYLYREIEWERSGVDYSAEVRLDLLTYAAGISLGIMSLSLGIPSINFRAIAEVFQRQEAVVAAEETLARAFAGVQQPRVDEGSATGGGLPRSFLLGGDPELKETVVMTATIRPEPSVGAGELSSFHWRSISYDVYTGRGWRRSPEREENIDRGQAIPEESLSGNPRAITVTQEVDWIYDRRATRYTLGRPIRFSHDLVALWRGQADFVGVRGRNNAPGRYSAESRLILLTGDQLRAAPLEDVPPEILARYTALPDTVPNRVRELAQQVAGAAPGATPYDQARAIETFLHQYPYSLDLSIPPADVDIVDYFLFDLQTGFCDYYASAMVVMARAVGLPARLAAGFLQVPADARDVQTVRQINAHSWAEVYFAGYGWVEFEPTAPFAVDAPAAPYPVGTVAPGATFVPTTSEAIAIPERAPERGTPWFTLLGLAALALVGWRLWGRPLVERLRHPPPPLDDVQRAYAHLQASADALGRPPHPAQTPAEFATELIAAPALAADGATLRPRIERLAQLFAVHLYGREKSAATGDEASAIWDALRDPLRRLVWRRRFGRQDN